MSIHHSRYSRGVSLVEAMVALAVMAFGMLAVVGVQSTLRFNADVARQRSEATRIGQEQLDELRSFTVIDATPGQRAWADIVDATRTETGLNAVYEVRSEIIGAADSPAKTIRVTVSWADRAAASVADRNQRVVLTTSIAAAAPALSGTLAVRLGTSPAAPVRRPMKRHPTIPVLAKDLGNGNSAFVPPGRPWIAFVFSNVTGVINGVCTFDHDTTSSEITISDVASCSNTITGQLLTGFVRFQHRSDGSDLTAADVEDPPGPALNMRMRISLTSTGHPLSPFCVDDANSLSVGSGDLKFATYYCVIYSNDLGAWSGATAVEPRNGFGSPFWEISGDESTGPGADARYRVCRYTTAASDAESVPNQDHPAVYAGVTGNLVNQNFVVIRSVKHCPTDVPADPASGDFVNSNTLQHQPPPP
jgi:Tfp pilus assembly protein PilV